jgi:arylsulfatase
METVDEETLDAAIDFIDRSHEAEEPFFVWYNSTRMHIWTRLKEESQGVTGLGVHPDGMVEHDGHVGQLLDRLDELGITENTIVMYSTDNGAETFSWPDGGTTPFRGEKNDNWEGGYRVPMLVRWPGQIEAGKEVNHIVSHLDWFPTIAGALGDDDIVEQLRAGMSIGDEEFRVHLDGYDFMPYMRGETEEPPRKAFFYFSDTGDLLNLRYDQYKIVFAEQRAHGFDVWQEPFTFLRLPKIFNIRSDPFEEADQIGMGYTQWRAEHLFLLVPAQAIVAEFLSTFVEYPPRQTPASFTIDQVMERLTQAPPQ